MITFGTVSDSQIRLTDFPGKGDRIDEDEADILELRGVTKAFGICK